MTAAIACAALLALAADPVAKTREGVVHFLPAASEAVVAERFRLDEHRFTWQSRLQAATDNFEIWEVTFPSPVTTPHELNNTVCCEYFRCRAGGRRPGVIVLH